MCERVKGAFASLVRAVTEDPTRISSGCGFIQLCTPILKNPEPVLPFFFLFFLLFGLEAQDDPDLDRLSGLTVSECWVGAPGLHNRWPRPGITLLVNDLVFFTVRATQVDPSNPSSAHSSIPSRYPKVNFTCSFRPPDLFFSRLRRQLLFFTETTLDLNAGMLSTPLPSPLLSHRQPRRNVGR